MSRILAGHFQLQDQIAQARAALIAAGFAAPRISAFYVNQPGQHDLYRLGGDRDISPGARETPRGVTRGVAAGGALGAALGAASAVVTGPAGPLLGALVGAHVGSLYSLHSMKEAGEAEAGPAAPRQAGPGRAAPDVQDAAAHPPGMLIAVALDDETQAALALALLRGLGAEYIEQAEGTISDGDWVDFDPLAASQRLPEGAGAG